MEEKKPRRVSLTTERRNHERAMARRNLKIGIAVIILTLITAIILTLENANEATISLAIVMGSTNGSTLICSYFRQKKKEQVYKDVDAALGIKRDDDTEE